LALLCVTQFVLDLDVSIIGVALPSIGETFGFSEAGLQWIFNAYVIAFGGLLLLGGRLGDLFGQRRVFAGGFLVLTLASLLAGLAPTAGVLIAGRALQGLGAALVAPTALAMILGLFAEPGERARAFGFWGASAAAGGSAGVFLGGVLTEWLDWRWVFLVNVPVGALVLLLVPALLRRERPRRGGVDAAGALSVTGALVLAVYAVVTANDAGGWATARTLGLLASAMLLLVAFVLVQWARREPLVPLGIFRAPNLSAGNAAMALLGASWVPLWFFLNLYLQRVLGYGALESGLALLPLTLAIMVGMVGVAGRVAGRFGPKPTLAAGQSLLALSLVLLALAPTDGGYLIHVLPATLITALGVAFSFVPATAVGTSGARPEEAGLASGLINTSYRVGSALGLAALTAVAGSFTPSAQTAGGEIAALNAGYHAAFIGAAAVAALGALVALAFVRDRPRDVRGPERDARARKGAAR
jgi:EmrB/QacA subfamily drug resistance transporter